MNNFNTHRRWYKNTLNKKISGVCSGLAYRLDFPVCHSTAVGLLHYARDARINDETEYSEPARSSVTSLFDRLRNWIQKEF